MAISALGAKEFDDDQFRWTVRQGRRSGSTVNSEKKHAFPRSPDHRICRHAGRRAGPCSEHEHERQQSQ
jgi:hypothetical protein